MSRITRKFWFRGDERWIVYCVNGKPIVVTREELDLREVA